MAWTAVVATWLARPGEVLAPGGDYSLVADIDTWRRTRRECLVRARYDLRLEGGLDALPLAIGRWHGEEMAPDPTTLELIRPEVYLPRVYTRDDGALVWLSLIAGREETRFHPPQACYGGWHTLIRAEQVPLTRGGLYALTMFASREQEAQLVYHFYLWPDRVRRLEDGVVMFKVTAPVQGNEKRTREVIRSFIATWFVEGHSTR